MVIAYLYGGLAVAYVACFPLDSPDIVNANLMALGLYTGRADCLAARCRPETTAGGEYEAFNGFIPNERITL